MARNAGRTGLDALPEFATDREIATALVGSARAAEIVAMMPMFELEGFPRVDPRFAGRYVPAVRQFLDRLHGIGNVPAYLPRGTVDQETWGGSKGVQGDGRRGAAQPLPSRRGPRLSDLKAANPLSSPELASSRKRHVRRSAPRVAE